MILTFLKWIVNDLLAAKIKGKTQLLPKNNRRASLKLSFQLKISIYDISVTTVHYL